MVKEPLKRVALFRKVLYQGSVFPLITLLMLSLQFLNVPAFRNVTLKCLTEIGE